MNVAPVVCQDPGRRTPEMAISSPSPRRHVRLALLLSGGALLGKVFGFLREILFARLLGTTFIADSYRGAVTATLLPIAPLQGDIVPSVLIPLHREWSAKGQGSRLFTPLIALFGAISVILTILVWMLAGYWVDIVVPGFSPKAHAMTELLVKVMALGMPASVMTACMSCIEISVGRSRITTLRATVQNIATILGVIGIAVTGQPVAIGISYVVGFWVLLIVGGYLLWREKEFAFLDVRLNTAMEAGGIFFRRARPLFLQPIADQANTLMERFAGSHLGVGSISSLDYSRTLTETAQFLVSQPIGYVVLAQDAVTGDRVQARVEALARPLLAFALPISLYIVVFAPEIVHIVYERGAFNAHGVGLTAGALRGIGCGLWAATLGYILLRMLNAAGRNGMVARVFVAAYVVNIAVNTVVTHYIGTLGLGLGEAARGLTVLIFSAILLDCGQLVFKLLLKGIPGLVAFGAIAYGIHQFALTPLQTLALGGIGVATICLSGVRPEAKLLLRRLHSRRIGADA